MEKRKLLRISFSLPDVYLVKSENRKIIDEEPKNTSDFLVQARKKKRLNGL